ncbi:MAG: AAA family ATPase [Planctomycetes bacterium]|nr:AAA family ATPase [Planctomycetota bacterium]
MPDSHSSTRSLFSKKHRRRHDGLRMVVTGQVGLAKKSFLQRVVEIAKENGQDVSLFNVGDRMYEEAPDIAPGRILDLPRQRLITLRRSVFKDILAGCAPGKNIIVNTHATFRWKHGLFLAYDHVQMEALDADLYVTVVDNVDVLHERLEREHGIAHTLKDILVWREEEIVVTEAMAEAIAGYGQAFVVSCGASDVTARSLYRLMFEPDRKKVYPSYPMTHVLDQPVVLAEIEAFRRWGADIICTTIYPEVVYFRELEICFAGLCWVSDAAGVEDEKDWKMITLEELQAIVSVAVGAIAERPECRCPRTWKGVEDMLPEWYLKMR